MILRNLWRRKTRTFLTLLGIAVGVAAVLAFSAFGEGMATGFEKTFTTSEADLIVAQKDSMMLLLSNVDDTVGSDLKKMSGVDQVAGVVLGFVTLQDSPYFVVMGHDPRNFAIQHYRLLEGAPLTSKKEILLGKTTAKNYEKKIGDSFRILKTDYNVVGIYETGVSMEDGGAVITLDAAQRAFDKKKQVSYYALKLQDVRRSDEIKNKIETRWEDLTATRSGEATTQTESLQLYRSFGWFLGIFAVLVGGLGMMNTMLMSVLERTREIGVLRALGWRRRRIVFMILGESLVLGLIGGGLGIALGLGLLQLTQLVPAVETLLKGILTPAMFAQALLIAVVLGAVGGILPALRAAQLAPVEAMRAEGGAAIQMGRLTRTLARVTGNTPLRNLFRRPTRTFVTLAGIGVGIGFLVALLAVTEGFTVLFAQLGGAGQADLIAEQAGVSDASLSTIDERTAERVARHPEVKAVSKLMMGFSSAPGLAYFIIFGLDPREEYIKHFRVREGRLIADEGEIMIGRFAANALEKKVGDTITVSGTRYVLVGIYENGSSFEDGAGVISLREAQAQFGKPRQVSFLSIAVRDPTRIDQVASQLEREFPEIIVGKPTEFTERMQDMQTMYAVLNALVVLTLIVGGIVMMNVMLMSVFERTQEIGVLRALGWRRRRILWNVLGEALALSVLSSLVGIVFGVGIGYLFTLAPGFGQFLLPAYTPAMLIQIFLVALVLGAIGGLYPAWRAANLRPIEALRYE
ncbi:MAG: ABC transporter permease [Chloroflexi bacterium]|nr:ABC transporter permease [Chloroflexota bacterium]